MKTHILKIEGEEKKIYYLVNMSTSDDFKKVAEILQNQFHAKFIKKVGAIWAYGEKYEYQGKFFILAIQDDDFECYLEAIDKKSPSEDEMWLERLAESIVEKINNFSQITNNIPHKS
ncbi:MAG: hypothetical protein LBK82_09740 [Planctomycetaceae bacterium]|jgi:hypothetical protein|nr:hypothetical protein [Planctomycetaceae bacterium]